MITNDRQYKIVKSQIDKFQESLDAIASLGDIKDVHPEMLQFQKKAIQTKLQELVNELLEYEQLKTGEVVIAGVNSLIELPSVLIKARIANGLTQSELANRLGIKEQQIQRLEAEKYESASLKTLLKVADSLGVSLNADVQIKEIEAPDSFDLKKYPFKQMFQRKWFPEFQGSLNEAAKYSVDLLAHFFEAAGIKNLQYAFNRRTVRADKAFNEYALNAWYARVVIEARKQELEVFFDKSLITEVWLLALAKLSIEEDGPKKAFKRLNDIGIRTVVEAQIEGTYLDGAALLVDNIYPVIAMTLRHDRLDNFWFVLFHEIAHVYLHLGTDYTMIFDDLDVNTQGIEDEADEYALNALIPNEIWRKSLVRFSPSNITIVNQAKKLNVHTALIAGRIRRETGKYFEFNDLIGQGQVKKLFTNELNS